MEEEQNFWPQTVLKSLKLQVADYKKLLGQNVQHCNYVDTVNLCKNNQENHSSILLRENITKQFTKKLKITLPYPLGDPKNYDLTDQILTLLEQKQKYVADIAWCKEQYKKDKKELNLKNILDSKITELPQYIVSLANGEIHDPDPYFQGDYNWYYTGGTLNKFQHNHRTYLIGSSGINSVCISEENTLNDHEIKLTEPFVLGLHTISNRSILTGLRHKNYLQLLKINFENTENVKELWSRYNPVPYIDFKLNEFSQNQVGCLNLKQKLELYDINKNSIILEWTFKPSTIDKLMQFNYLNDTSLVAIDRKNIFILDKRSKTLSESHVQEGYFECDNLCTFSLSKNSNYLYLSSVHSLYKFDLRCMKQVKKWPHFLQAPPLISKIHYSKGNEYVFISSQNFNGKVILKENESENSFCQHVPTSLETLRKSNFIRPYNLHEDLVPRLKLSTMGLEITEDEETDEIKLYSLGSNGNLFKNKISDSWNDEDSVNLFLKWFDQLPIKLKEIKITSLKNMSKMKMELMKTRECDEEVEVLSKFKEKNKKINELLKEVDHENFYWGEIWECEKIESDEDDEDMQNKVDSNLKVSEWLHSKMDSDNLFEDSR